MKIGIDKQPDSVEPRGLVYYPGYTGPREKYVERDVAGIPVERKSFQVGGTEVSVAIDYAVCEMDKDNKPCCHCDVVEYRKLFWWTVPKMIVIGDISEDEGGDEVCLDCILEAASGLP